MRALVGITLGVLVAVVSAVAVAGCAVRSSASVNTVGERQFEQELRIPPLLEPRIDGAGRKVFDLDLQQGRAELLPGTTAETWGINGPHLGPTRSAHGPSQKVSLSMQSAADWDRRQTGALLVQSATSALLRESATQGFGEPPAGRT